MTDDQPQRGYSIDDHMRERALLRTNMQAVWPSTAYLTAAQLEHMAPSAQGAPRLDQQVQEVR